MDKESGSNHSRTGVSHEEITGGGFCGSDDCMRLADFESQWKH